MQDQVKDRLDLLQREISFRENEVGKLKNEIRVKSEEAATANVSSQNYQGTVGDLQAQLLSKDA